MPDISFGWHDAVGMLGVALLLTSYFMLQIGRLDGQDIVYSACNGIAAILIIISLFYTFNLASFVIEVFWLAISLIGVFRWLKTRKQR